MTNDLVTYEELLKFKTGMKESEVNHFLENVRDQVAEECNCKQDEVYLDLKRDETNDPDAMSQKYIVYPKHPTNKIEKFFTEMGPFTLYVKM